MAKNKIYQTELGIERSIEILSMLMSEVVSELSLPKVVGMYAGVDMNWLQIVQRCDNKCYALIDLLQSGKIADAELDTLFKPHVARLFAEQTGAKAVTITW